MLWAGIRPIFCFICVSSCTQLLPDISFMFYSHFLFNALLSCYPCWQVIFREKKNMIHRTKGFSLLLPVFGWTAGRWHAPRTNRKPCYLLATLVERKSDRPLWMRHTEGSSKYPETLFPHVLLWVFPEARVKQIRWISNISSRPATRRPDSVSSCVDTYALTLTQHLHPTTAANNSLPY